jgi:outer membrane protein assembly factor BamB
MQLLKRKNKAISIAFITLMVTSLAFTLTTQQANAYNNTNYTTYTYVFPGQPVVGVGQQILIEMYVNANPPTAIGSMGDRWTFYLTITSPGGVNETQGPITSDPVGGAYIVYVPQEVGTYTIQVRSTGKTLTGEPGNTGNANVNNTYAPSMSPPNTFVVQQDLIPSYKETPITQDYWTRPIYDANRGWGNAIMGQWLGGTYYETNLRARGIPNQEGPESSHILWSRSIWTGGIMGGGYDDVAYYNGIAYEAFSSPMIALDGKTYYSVQSPPRYGWYCINLYTGDTIYYQNNTNGDTAIPSLAQVLNYASPNQDGGFSYLWRTSGVTLPAGSTTASGLSTWEMLDSFTGNSICKIANVSTTGTQFRDSIGSICAVNFANVGTSANPKYYMQIWNSTQAIWWRSSYGIAYPATLINGVTNVPNTDSSDNNYWLWRPSTSAVYNGYNGYSMNISVTSLNGPQNAVLNETATVRDVFPDKYVVVGTAGRNDVRGVAQGSLWAYSLAPNTWGNISWSVTFTPPMASDNYPIGNGTAGGGVSLGGVSVANDVFWFTERVTGKIWVYSLSTGQQLWTYTDSSQLIDEAGYSLTVHDGKAFTSGAYGECHCFNATTGESLWNFTAPLLGNLEGQGLTYSPLIYQFSVDNVETGRQLLYFHGTTAWAGETSPIRRDGSIFCLDATTGQLVWRLMAYPNMGNNALAKTIISEGRITFIDSHDNQIYCVGRGSSGTTVSAPQTANTLGSTITLTGTVTDQSPSGKHDVNGDLAIALKGTAAIGDTSMDAWMQYLYHQGPKPENATGVVVSLDTVDPNGNYIHIGNATSDSSGNYGFPYTPYVPGTYQIIATFAGSKAYGPSSSTTYLTVNSPQQTTFPVSTPMAQSVADTYFIPAIAALFALNIVVAIVIVILILRKRA